jgi:Plasmid pRiA4b ORF-3-like protein
MIQKTSLAYQFKITLDQIPIPVWRRILVPDYYSFWDLHVAIQDAMGWLDYHLHEFQIINPNTEKLVRIGIPDDEFEVDRVIKPGWRVQISDYFSLQYRIANYVYDFGDDWNHTIVLEDFEVFEPGRKYPICLEGSQACPPEDVGGPHGYKEFIDIIQDPKHPEHDDMLVWVGGSFDPSSFNPKDIQFDDPKERWNIAFE